MSHPEAQKLQTLAPPRGYGTSRAIFTRVKTFHIRVESCRTVLTDIITLVLACRTRVAQKYPRRGYGTAGAIIFTRVQTFHIRVKTSRAVVTDVIILVLTCRTQRHRYSPAPWKICNRRCTLLTRVQTFHIRVQPSCTVFTDIVVLVSACRTQRHIQQRPPEDMEPGAQALHASALSMIPYHWAVSSW